MFVVALTELATSLEEEAPALAADLGVTTYEARLALNAGLPAIVLRTVDRAGAEKLLAGLTARGHGAVACDAATVVPCDRMTLMRRFVFEPDAIAIADRKDETLPFADIAALLRATHRTRTETETDAKTKKFSMGRALASGGLMLTKTVASKERSISAEAEQVLYLFRRSGAPPWLLRERAANYAALGAELAPSSAQNFTTTLRRLQKLAPGAVYSERLVTLRAGGSHVSRSVGTNSESVAATSAGGIDLLAHVIALSIAAGAASR